MRYVIASPQMLESDRASLHCYFWALAHRVVSRNLCVDDKLISKSISVKEGSAEGLSPLSCAQHKQDSD